MYISLNENKQMLYKILVCIIILTSIFSCKKETINGRYKTVSQIIVGSGPEDILFDKNNNRILELMKVLF